MSIFSWAFGDIYKTVGSFFLSFGPGQFLSVSCFLLGCRRGLLLLWLFSYTPRVFLLLSLRSPGRWVSSPLSSRRGHWHFLLLHLISGAPFLPLTLASHLSRSSGTPTLPRCSLRRLVTGCVIVTFTFGIELVVLFHDYLTCRWLLCPEDWDTSLGIGGDPDVGAGALLYREMLLPGLLLGLPLSGRDRQVFLA